MYRKPALGHPTRTDAVMAMRADGIAPGAIAAAIGISTAAVSALETHGRRRSGFGNRTSLLPGELLDALKPDADLRGITPNALVRRLIETIVDEGMVDNVLDDGVRRD